MVSPTEKAKWRDQVARDERDRERVGRAVDVSALVGATAFDKVIWFGFGFLSAGAVAMLVWIF